MYVYRNGITMTTMIHASQIDLDLGKDENPVLRFDQYSAFVRVKQGQCQISGLGVSTSTPKLKRGKWAANVLLY